MTDKPAKQHISIPLSADSELNERQKRFCEEFLEPENKFSAPKAYVAAGYSKTSAATNAYELYNKPHIQAYIMELKARRMQRQEVSVARVVETLMRLARKAESDRKYAPAIRAIELVGKHVGMFHEKIDMDINYDAKGDTPEIDAEIERLLKILPDTDKKKEITDETEETLH